MHTRGPWQWWTSNSWKRLKRDHRGITQNVLEPYVCRDGHPDLIVSEADMKLIAAAPEMLLALKAAEVVIRNRDQSEGEARIFGIIRTAIAKAEGEALT